MIGGLSKHTLSHHLRQAKNVIGGTILNTKNLLNHVDQGVKTFKDVYRVAAPILESYGIPSGQKVINSVLSGYDMVRNVVSENANRLTNDINRIKEPLGKKSVIFDFA